MPASAPWDFIASAMRARAGNVLVLPQVLFDEGGDLGGGVDFGLFGEDHAPAALGLGAAHLDHGRGVAVAAAVAMRHLVEAVLRGLGADLHRLEQDVVAGIAQLQLPATGGRSCCPAGAPGTTARAMRPARAPPSRCARSRRDGCPTSRSSRPRRRYAGSAGPGHP